MSHETSQREAGEQEKPDAVPRHDPRVLLALARDHHRAGRMAEAEELYRKIINAWPEAAKPRHLLGILYGQNARADDAVEQIAAATRLTPNNPIYFNDLGHALLAAHRLVEAADAYRHAIELRPDFGDAHFNLGNLLRLQGKPREAVAAYQRAIDANPGALHVYINLGVTLQEIADYEEAIKILRQAIVIDARSFAAHYNLGIVFAAQRRFDEAILAYRKALAIDPQAPSAHLNLGFVLQQLHRLDEAIPCYGRAIAAAPDLAQAHVNLGSALYEKGQLTAALGVIGRALALEPLNAQTHVNLAQTLQELGDLQGAEAAFRRALELEPGLVVAKAHFSIALQQAGKRDEARALLDYPVLLQTRRLERVEGWPAITAFNAELAEYVYGHPTLMRDPPAKATKYGSQTMEIFNCADRPILALQRFIEDSVADYIATNLSAAKTAFAAAPPPAWQLHGWAVVLRSAGHQTPHFHPAAVVSGVYYVRVPEIVKAGSAGEAGFIKFGHPRVGTAGAKAGETPLTASVRPEEGMIVLFPSYFWHYTVPFESQEDRISIAFDVLPAPDGAAAGANEANAAVGGPA